MKQAVSPKRSTSPLPVQEGRSSHIRSSPSNLFAAESNQAVQRLFHTGAIQAKLTISQPGDPDEQEADRVADQVMRMAEPGPITSAPFAIQRKCAACEAGGTTCPKCEEEQTVQRKGKPGHTPQAADSIHTRIAALRGGGQPLPPSVKSFFEPRFGRDFSGVRVHTDGRAAESARAIQARAYATYQDVVFGPGEYAPESQNGRNLLAHELAHIALGHGGVRRQAGGVCSAEGPVCEASVPEPAGMSSITDPAEVNHDTSFDPCAVNVTALTNYELLAEYANALRVVGAGRDAPGYFDYRNLQRRLIVERDRRVELGHAWLATMPLALPDPIYQIVDGVAGSFSVLALPAATIAGTAESSPSPYMTWDQFQHFLDTHNVERVSETEYLLRVPPVSMTTSASLSSLSLLPMRGGLRTTPFGFSPGTPSSVLGGISSPVPDVIFDEGISAIDSEAIPFELGYGRTLTRRLATGGSVPLDHPIAFDIDEPLPVGDPNARYARRVARALDPQNRQLLDRITNQRTKGLGIDFRDVERGRSPLPEVSLADEPSAVFTRRFGEVTELRGVFEEALAQIPDVRVLEPTALKNQINANMRKIIRNGRSPSGVAVREALRSGGFEIVPGLGIVAVRPSSLRIAGMEGIRGAGVSGGIAVLGSALYMLGDSADHPDWDRELAISGVVGTGSGAAGSVTESLIYSTTMRAIDRSLAETGATSLTPAFARGAGRLGGGAVGAVFVEGISMGLLEEREHSGAEIAVRGTRSALLGAGSVWAGAGIVAAAGSVVPVAGTAVGFIVGLLAGAALYYVGDRIVPGGREDWDAYEAGCNRSPTSSHEEPRDWHCFIADTQVTLSDGRLTPIELIRPGDRVLAIPDDDIERAAPRACAVEAVLRHPPANYLLLQLDDGKSIRVTHNHPLFANGDWRSAGTLCIGDTIAVLDAGRTNLSHAGITHIMAKRGELDVYDLVVADCHTYFADGALAHNKNI